MYEHQTLRAMCTIDAGKLLTAMCSMMQLTKFGMHTCMRIQLAPTH